MRLKDGGCGFGGLPTRSAVAFLGSWHQCLHEVAADLGCESVAGFQAGCPNVAASMERAAHHASNLGCFNGKGMDWLSPLKESMPKMQRLLAKQVAAQQKKDLMSSLGDDEAADVHVKMMPLKPAVGPLIPFNPFKPFFLPDPVSKAPRRGDRHRGPVQTSACAGTDRRSQAAGGPTLVKGLLGWTYVPLGVVRHSVA